MKRLHEFDIIMWFVNVPNEYAKLVSNIKEANHKALLITSKNNLEGKYSYQELLARMLKVKANLTLVFTKNPEGKILGTLLDPLGNSYIEQSSSIPEICKALTYRIVDLRGYARAGSRKVGDTLRAPPEADFFGIAHRCAETFHSLIHAHDTERFLGNLSFRCEKGFPSYIQGGVVYVSRRNIDKRLIGEEGFVGVSTIQELDGAISYYGDFKPSVDTPVQVALYNKFHKIRYMIHSHVYIEGAPFTEEKIPCGALAEIDSILSMVQDPELMHTFCVNLYGHGSIVMTDDLKFFNTIKYKSRPLPETDWRNS
jgi:hypothetical protein